MQIQRNLFARTEPESQNYCNKYNGIFIERKKTKTEIVFANFEQLAENEITTAETTAMAIAFRRAHQGRYLRAILYLCTTRFEWKRLKFDEWSDLQRTANTNRELGSQIPDFRPCLLFFLSIWCLLSSFCGIYQQSVCGTWCTVVWTKCCKLQNTLCSHSS